MDDPALGRPARHQFDEASGVPWKMNSPADHSIGMKSISVPIGGEGSSPLPMPSKNSAGDSALTSASDRLPGPARRARMASS